jgi:hypothetical protein
MNYQRIHDAIIDRARNRTLLGYREKHHVIPRCMGGVDDKDNLVELTAREHFIVHKLLCKIYPTEDKLFFAYRMMAIMKTSKDNERGYYVSSREFEEIRLLANEKISNAMRGKKMPPRPQVVIEKIVAARHANTIKRGYYHSNETKQKISTKNKGKTLSKEHVHNLRESHLNNPKCTGKAATPEKEEIRKQKIKDSWVIRKLKKDNKL